MLNHGGSGVSLYFLPPCVGVIVFAFLALIAILRGKKNSTTYYFIGLCVLGVAINSDIALVGILGNRALALQIDRLVYLFFVFSIPLYIQFVHAFLGIGGRKWLEYLAYALSAVFLQFVPTEYFIRGFRDYDFWRIAEAGPAHAAFSIAGGLTVLYCLITLMRAMTQAPDNVRKNRIRYVTIGIGLSSFLILLDAIPIAGIHLYPIGNFNFVPAIILAFGILKYNLLDVEVLIRKGTAYIVLTGILTLFAVTVLYIMNLLRIQMSGTHFLIVVLLVIALIVPVFNPLRRLVRRLVNAFFKGRAYEYRTALGELDERLSRLHRVDDIAACVPDAVRCTFDLHHAALILCGAESETLAYYPAGVQPVVKKRIFFEGWEEVAAFFRDASTAVAASVVEHGTMSASLRYGLKQLYQILGASLIIPVISGRGALSGILALGEKKSGELFIREDIALLGTVAGRCAAAVESARSYEWLEALNMDLEGKVRSRTAELVRALQEKERTQAQLIRSESLASIGQLVAGVAHELNNPLAGASSLIQSSVETLRRCGLKDRLADELIDDLAFSLKELTRAGNIVRSLLGLSRQTPAFIEQVDMNMLINDSIRLLHSQVNGRPVEFVRNFDHALPCIEGNYAHLGQVMLNIIKNAIHALSDGGGTITLTTCAAGDNGYITVECRDTGSGIPGGILKDIFKPFFTTKSPGEGTGLGLYIAHEIVMRHEGNITVRTVEDRGTAVTVELPRRRGEP
ncbi:MAG: ATP-binding protein [Deltaproteobacteria bacterium]|nr:ATP-binding protein [Deltaproteobacteria bacterium]